MKRNRDEILDAIKGIAIFIVVLRHVIQGGSSDSATVLIANIIFAIQMPLFIFISGYFGGNNYRDRKYTFSYFKIKMKKNTISYLVPFLSFFIIFKVIILKQYTNDFFEMFTVMANDITTSLWYLFVVWVLGIILGLATLVTTLIFRKIQRRQDFELIFFIIVYLCLLLPILFIMISQTPSFLGTKLILYYSLFYLFGYLSKCFKTEILNFSKISIYKISVKDFMYTISILVFTYLCVNFLFLNIEDNISGIFIRFTAAITGIYVLFYFCYSNKEKINNKYLKILGIYSLEIYYVHSLLIRVMNIDNDSGLFTVKGFLNTSILFLLVSAFTYVIVLFFNSNNITKFIVFGKRSK